MNLHDLPLFQKISLVDKFNFYEYISVMLDGWVSISETLWSVQAKVRNPFFKEKIEQIQTYVSSGDSLSKSMRKVPQIFSQGEISIVESWETTWKLAQSLSNLAEDLRKAYDLRAKIKAALTYPIIIFAFLILALVIVLAYVIPAVSQLFITSGVELPAATKALIKTSDFMVNGWPYIIFFILTACVLFYGYKNTETGKANLDYQVLRLPLVWKVLKNYHLASLSASLWTLISAWVPVVKSINLSAKSLGNLAYEVHLNDVMNKVAGWQKIVESMQEVDELEEFFPADFLQMLSVWEKTASLDSVTGKITKQYTREVDYSLANLTKWIEPIAILISWVFVLWFAFAIFGAILKVTQTVS